jgi:acetylglutamate kinase
VGGVKVLKVGGSALTDASWLRRLAEAASRATCPLVLVHGGGPEITALSARLDVPVSWSGGRRVTTAEALAVASMVLNGAVNKRIVAALVGAGVDALGVSGEDAALVRAELAEGGALGHVGRVGAVRAELLQALLAAGLLPVVSPMSRGPDGAALNVNADEVAAAVAAALGAAELLFLTNVPGVRDEHGVRAALTTTEAAGLVARGVAREGMAVKLGAAVAAAEAGVAQVRVGPLEMIASASAGTLVAAHAEAAA